MERACKKLFPNEMKYYGFRIFPNDNFSERQFFRIIPAKKIGPHLFRLIHLEMFRRLRHALRHPPHARMVPFLLLTEAEALPDDEVSVTTAHTHT